MNGTVEQRARIREATIARNGYARNTARQQVIAASKKPSRRKARRII